MSCICSRERQSRLPPYILPLILASLALTTASCSRTGSKQPVLTLATTTSTDDSGLLDDLLAAFESRTNIQVRVVAVGSGRALDLGRNGDADVLLTHAPTMEEAFLRDGYGERRVAVMANDFIIIGPRSDPAGVNGSLSAKEALVRIEQANQPFISRGDRSGTHIKEVSIRQSADLDLESDHIVDCGDGMAAALRIAHEKQGYTLTDRGTFLSLQDRLDLVIVHEGDPDLLNPYTAMVVSRDRHPNINTQAAHRFVDFLISNEAQNIIAKFGIDKYGEALFLPNSSSTRAFDSE